ncbi:MAG TPA: biotin/lipoyl-binding protein [Desulfocapsa sulfexigens]|nr:biotin/lipoyl-binding protein [Desulfocapsa sulfexigens]
MMKINFDRKKQKDPERDHEMKVKYAPAKRKIAQFRWYLILLFVASPLLYFLGKMAIFLLVVDAPSFVSLGKNTLNASITGVVERLAVKSGDIVAVGDPIIILKDPRLDEREKILRAELKTLNSPLPPTGSGVETLLRDRAVLAKNMVNYQEDKLEKMRYLFRQGAATRAELNLAEGEYNKARYTYNVAQSQLSERLENIQKANLGLVAHAALRTEQIEIELSVIEEQREKLTHRSTVHARVLDIFVKEGMTISPGTTMLILGEYEGTVITSYLQPKYAKYARAGHKATIRLPDGTKIVAKVKRDSGLTRRLPADLASPIGSRDLMIIVKLEPVETIPPMLMIDGLPVSARFHTFDFLSALELGK